MKYQIVLKYSVLALCGALAIGCASNSGPLETDKNQQVASSQNTEESSNKKPEAQSISNNSVVINSDAASERYPHININNTNEPEKKIYYFDFAESNVSDEDLETLKSHAAFLRENPEILLQVNGHTDRSGTQAYNEYLSKKRAEAIAKSLIEFGAPETQLTLNALASSQPLDGHDAAKQRRVELEYTEMNLVSTE